MINTTKEQVQGIAMAMLEQSEKAADSLSVKGVAEMTEADHPDEVFVLFHIKKDDIARMKDLFFITIEGASKGFGDTEDEK